jgi:hypothetical protein
MQSGLGIAVAGMADGLPGGQGGVKRGLAFHLRRTSPTTLIIEIVRKPRGRSAVIASDPVERLGVDPPSLTQPMRKIAGPPPFESDGAQPGH